MWLHALLVFPHIVLVGVAEIYVVETLVLLTSAKKHVEPGSDLLGYMLRLEQLSLDSHEIMLVRGPFREDNLVYWDVGTASTQVGQVVVPEYLREIEELRCELAVILWVIVKRLPLISERIEYAVRVIQPIVYFDKVISEWLHTD